MDLIEDAGAKVVESVTSLFWGEQGTASDKLECNRHNSFAKIRENVHAKWYVDAKDYYYAVSEALDAAKHEIFIEDWWLSPELYLRRPPCKNEDYRLDKLLKKKADQGVKIYIIMYKEVTQALTMNSKYSKDILKKHPNILVQRHPNHTIKGTVTKTILWAHHEKMVVIDRHVAFLGGLDLCFGRYDTHTHQLADYHSASNNYSIWPGQDYSNPRIKDFIDVHLWAKVLIDKKQTARMPWHDIHLGIIGKPALDEARHFIERWNFIKKEKGENKPQYPVLISKSDRRYDFEMKPNIKDYIYFGKSVKVHPEKGSCKVQICRSSAEWSHGIETEHSILNAYIDVIGKAKHFIYIENQYFITATKDSPDYPVKNLVGKAIVDRIVRAHKEKEPFRIIVVMPLLPAFPAELDTSEAGTVRLVIHYQYQSICRGGHSILEKLRDAGIKNPENYIKFFSLRKYDKIEPKKIDEAKGILEEEKPYQKGEHIIPTGIVDTDKTETFVTEELYIHSKLLIADDRIVICGSANLNDRSLIGDHDSEIAAVIEDTHLIDSRMAGKNWKAGRYAATLRRAIFKEHLGLGLESDHETLTPNSHPPPHHVELECDRDRLSAHDRTVEDPASDDFFHNTWSHTAKQNTEIYREIFHCTPDDTVKNWDEFKAFTPDHEKIPLGHVCNEDKNPKEVEDELKRIHGHLVEFPLNFMQDTTLSGSVVFDAVTPMELFT